jgi:beta-phosphoglucomutase-like phosphatase (HAD superfamily)
MGIASTTSRANVDALLRHHLGASWEHRFAAIVCGEDVRCKKPDPEVYRLALRALGDASARVVAIEDAPDGVAAARAAGLPVLVTRSAFFQSDAIAGAIAIGPDLRDRRGWRPALRGHESARRIGLDDIADWLAQDETVARHD